MRSVWPFLLVLAGCSVQLTVPTATPEPLPGTTEPCRSEGEVVAAFDRFIAAFNSGETPRLRATVSRYGEWYSLRLRSDRAEIYGQDQMVHHLYRMSRNGDRLSLPRIRVIELVGWDGSAHFAVNAIRLTRDGHVLTLHGKGVLQCRGFGEGILVLSLDAT